MLRRCALYNRFCSPEPLTGVGGRHSLVLLSSSAMLPPPNQGEGGDKQKGKSKQTLSSQRSARSRHSSKAPRGARRVKAKSSPREKDSGTLKSDCRKW